jgi:hypothetical protein
MLQHHGNSKTRARTVRAGPYKFEFSKTACWGIPRSFGRNCLYDLDVEAAKFQSRSAVGNAAGIARAARLCRFCQHGVGDDHEMHMLAECAAYDAVRRSHADLFSDLGGWMDFPSDISAAQFRAPARQPSQCFFCVLVLSDAGSNRRWM